MKTLDQLEADLNARSRECAVASGLPNYPSANKRRARTLLEIALHRPLTLVELQAVQTAALDRIATGPANEARQVAVDALNAGCGNPFADDDDEARNCPTCGRLIDSPCPGCAPGEEPIRIGGIADELDA